MVLNEKILKQKNNVFFTRIVDNFQRFDEKRKKITQKQTKKVYIHRPVMRSVLQTKKKPTKYKTGIHFLFTTILFYSDLINENEVYSLRQLEAFNALSASEKLELQTKAIKRSAESKIDHISPKQETFAANNIKLEVVDDYPLLNKTNTTIVNNSNIDCGKTSDLIIVPETPVRRVLIANQLNSGAVAKANPKAVTASVFKTIPTGAKQSFKIIGGDQLNSNGNSGNSRAPQAVTSTLIQPIVAGKRDTFGKIQSNIAKPSLVPRQTVVTASLFQPRTTTTGPKFSSTNTVNQQASRAAETMNKSFCMLSDDLSQPTCEYLFRNKLFMRIISFWPPTDTHTENRGH